MVTQLDDESADKSEEDHYHILPSPHHHELSLCHFAEVSEIEYDKMDGFVLAMPLDDL